MSEVIRRTFTFQIAHDVYEALKKRAAAADRSMSYITHKYVEEGLRHDGYLSPESPRSSEAPT